MKTEIRNISSKMDNWIKHPKIPFVYFRGRKVVCTEHPELKNLNMGSMRQHIEGKKHGLDFNTGKPLNSKNNLPSFKVDVLYDNVDKLPPEPPKETEEEVLARLQKKSHDRKINRIKQQIEAADMLSELEFQGMPKSIIDKFRKNFGFETKPDTKSENDNSLLKMGIIANEKDWVKKVFLAYITYEGKIRDEMIQTLWVTYTYLTESQKNKEISNKSNELVSSFLKLIVSNKKNQ